MSTEAKQDDRDRLLGHEYDGIREYDNPLPGWWVWIFIATIVFSGGYYGWYQLGPGQTVIAEYEEEVRLAAERVPQPVAGATAVSDDVLAALQKDAKTMASAKEVFASRCAACHGPEGQGIIGPNLTDDYWLHGGQLTAIRKVIAEGVPAKGMVPWKDQLKPGEIDAVTAYVASLRGTHPSNPKPPQGTKASAADISLATISR
jgi:cytochrome c oxidase cbb3-type subunit 3